MKWKEWMNVRGTRYRVRGALVEENYGGGGGWEEAPTGRALLALVEEIERLDTELDRARPTTRSEEPDVEQVLARLSRRIAGLESKLAIRIAEDDRDIGGIRTRLNYLEDWQRGVRDALEQLRECS